jgi:patatin-like phospholipase/acyl hydrolase
MPIYRILSLDGGGIRGVLTAAILERLEQFRPGFLQMIDLFAGTSTGGILALGLASGLTPGEARELYERLAAQVFTDTILDDIMDLGQMVGAQYPNDPLKKVLFEQFGDLTLGDLPKKVLITSFDLDNEKTGPGEFRFWKPKFFHNYPGPGSDSHEKVVDVALRTSAAPTFFPLYQGFIDGGVVSNNPSMCALAQALEPSTGNQELRNIRLISLGTGYNTKFLSAADDDWGLLRWAPHLVSLILEGSVGLSDYQCRQVLDAHYLRVNPVLPVAISLDNIREIPLLKGLATQLDLEAARDFLKRYFRAPAAKKETSPEGVKE